MIFIALFVMASVLNAVDRQGLHPPFNEDDFVLYHPQGAPTFYWNIGKEDVFPVTRSCSLRSAERRAITSVHYGQETCNEACVTLVDKGAERVSVMMREGVVSFAYNNAPEAKTPLFSKSWNIGEVIDGGPKTACLCWGDKERAKVMWFRYESKDAQRGYFIGGEVTCDSFMQPKLIWGLADYNGNMLYEYKGPVDFDG